MEDWRMLSKEEREGGQATGHMQRQTSETTEIQQGKSYK